MTGQPKATPPWEYLSLREIMNGSEKELDDDGGGDDDGDDDTSLACLAAQDSEALLHIL